MNSEGFRGAVTNFGHKLKEEVRGVFVDPPKPAASGESTESYQERIRILEDELANNKIQIEELQRRLALMDESFHDIDPLTKLPQSATYEKKLAEVQASKKPFALFVIDANALKKLNDTVGHSAGDEYLKNIANFLLAHFSTEDTVCRIHGDEFIVLSPGMTKDVAKERGTTMANMLNEGIQKRDSVTSISIGVVVVDDQTSLDIRNSSFDCADAAMYKAKEESKKNMHKNGGEIPLAVFHMYDPSNHGTVEELFQKKQAALAKT